MHYYFLQSPLFPFLILFFQLFYLPSTSAFQWQKTLFSKLRFTKSADSSISNKNKLFARNVDSAELNDKTLWQVGLSFKKNNELKTRASLRIRFVCDRQYEPPQGRIFVEDDFNGLVKTDERGFAGTWTLSEDKENRKDGLWIWGLFEEPKYPFLYFYLDIYDTLYIDDKEVLHFVDSSVPGGRLFVRFDHVYVKNEGSELTNGRMEFKDSEFVRADPMGIGGRVDVGEMRTAGSINISPSVEDAALLNSNE